MTTPEHHNGERILAVAPTGADAYNLSAILGKAGLATAACPDVSVVVAEIENGCGAVLLTEEALNHPRHRDLADALQRQPAWSDIPLILVVSGGRPTTAGSETMRLLGSRGNITLVERPLHGATLLSTLQAALRARRRQYEVRQLLHERDDLLASLERRVAERTAKLEELNAELESFSYSVSHDLRAPLRALEGYSRILCEEFSDTLPKEARHYAERIAKNAEQMDQLTRDVLVLSRLTRGDLTMDVVNLDEIVAQVINQYPDLAAASHHIDVATPLGHALGHGPSLTQCFSNLLQNALKFVPAGRMPHIRVFGAADGDRVRVSVQDNGAGIDAAHHKRIFGIFERVGTTHVPGTGIGLAIAKRAVERMGGTIGVESSPGEGARFWIELAEADPRVKPARGDCATAGRS